MISDSEAHERMDRIEDKISETRAAMRAFESEIRNECEAISGKIRMLATMRAHERAHDRLRTMLASK